MNVVDNNKGIRIAGGVLFVILGLLAGIEGFFLLFGINTDRDILLVVLLLFFTALIIVAGIIMFRGASYSRRFDETGIYEIKRGTVYNTVKWDDFQTAYFKAGRGNKLFFVHLSPRILDAEEQKRITKKAGKEYGIYTIMFTFTDTWSKEYREIIEFIEKKYGVSFS